jgi:hypothetical protein
MILYYVLNGKDIHVTQLRKLEEEMEERRELESRDRELAQETSQTVN